MQDGKKLFAQELAFTETYRKYENGHPAIREAMSLKVQYPAILPEIKEGDIFAGRVLSENGNLAVGFLMSARNPDIGYVCNESNLINKLNGKYGKSKIERGKDKEFEIANIEHSPHISLESSDIEDEDRKDLEYLLDFWRDRTTHAHFWNRVITERPENIINAMPDRSDNLMKPMICSYGDRMATATLDFDKLLQLGIPGMFDEIRKYKEKAVNQGVDEKLFEGMEICLDLLKETCLWYSNQAREKAVNANEKNKNNLLRIAESLENLTKDKPKNLHEAIQLFWLYAMLAHITNFGRMDVYLGDFYVKDIDEGRLTEEKGISMIQSLWVMMESFCGTYSGGVMIGGKGRRNEKNADKFAIAAMEAMKKGESLVPQLRLRVYNEMNPKVFDKALDLIGEGRTFPILVNDDVNIDACKKAFSASEKEAEQYLVVNCGDITLDHISFGSPNSFILLSKILEVTLYNGFDPVSKTSMGLKTGKFTEFKTFEEFFNAYKKQAEFFVDAISDRNQIFNEVIGENPFLFVSMLYDDCLERGKGVFSGGARYLGGIIETYGNITTSDSLAAIKELVFDKKQISKKKLLKILESNFNGYEKERALMRKVPKFGNDEAIADEMASEVNKHIMSYILSQKKRPNLDYVVAEYVNAGGNIPFGKATGATPDGRLAGTPINNANNPVAGNDRKGPTALLNSMARVDREALIGFGGAGVFQILHLNKNLFKLYRDDVKGLLQGFFLNGGTLLQVSVLNKEDLERAMREPEKYQNLIVRVGGFSARFVELNKDLQQDIVNRTVY